ncbi:MAG: acyl carrier protein [Planctomycetota bacterium]|jgi:acyl carrier protein
MTETDIYEKLKPLIREVTGASEDAIAMESILVADLGAESLDLLDLSFLIEEEFSITLEADEFERLAKARMDGQPYEADGYLTEAALAELARAMPEVPAENFAPPLRKMDVPALLTVAVFVHLVQRKLAEKADG